MHTHHCLVNGTITAGGPASSALVSTLDDYPTFLLSLINRGTHPTGGGSILKPSTMDDYVFTDLAPVALTGDVPQNGPSSSSGTPPTRLRILCRVPSRDFKKVISFVSDQQRECTGAEEQGKRCLGRYVQFV
jgi:hypothetical protein